MPGNEAAHEAERLGSNEWQLSLLPANHLDRVAGLVNELQQASDVKVGAQALLAARSDVALQYEYAQIVAVAAVEEYFRQLLHDATGFETKVHGPRVGVYLLAVKVRGTPTPDQL